MFDDDNNDLYKSNLSSPILDQISSPSSQNNDWIHSKDEQISEKEYYYQDLNLNKNIVKNDSSNEALIQNRNNNNNKTANDINLLDKPNLISSNTQIGMTCSNTKLFENLTKNGVTQNVGTITIFQEQTKNIHETTKEKELYNNNDDTNDNKGLLNKKRNKSLEDKGSRKNQMLNVYKTNFINVAQNEFSEMIKKTKFYSDYKKNFNKIKNKIYTDENSSNNLLFLDKKLKDVLSHENENNAFIIKKLDENNAYYEGSPHLKQNLEKTILDLMYYYSDKCNLKDLNEEFAQHLRKKYDELIQKLEKKGKSPEYIEIFTDIIKNIQNEYKNMKSNKVGKKKKNNISSFSLNSGKNG
jgi:hypothetical protein